MPPVVLKSSRFSPQPHWKTGDEDAVGRGDREQVQHDRLDGDDDGAEGHQQEREGEEQDEREHERRRVFIASVKSARRRWRR